MIQRTLHSRSFVSTLLAMSAGAFLYYTHPFPTDQIFLRVITLRAPRAFLSFECLYNVALSTTPFMAFSTVALGPLHLHAKSPSEHLASPSSSVSRPVQEGQPISWLARSTTLANWDPPRHRDGSLFPNADCSPGSRFSARSEPVRRAAVCTRLPNRFSRTKQPTRRGGLAG